MNRMNAKVIGAMAGLLAVALFTAPDLSAQSEPEGRFGMYAGTVFSSVGAGSMRLELVNDGFSFNDPEDLSDGQGLGPAFGAIYEYHSGYTLGATMRLGAVVNVAEMENSDTGIFTTSVNYFTIEPGIRLGLTDDIAVSLGPTIGVLISAKYDFDPSGDDNLGFLEGVAIDGMNDVVYGAWLEGSYDIQIRGDDDEGDTPIYLTPYLGAGVLMDQRGSAIPDQQDEFDDVWTTISARLGLQLKFGVM